MKNELILLPLDEADVPEFKREMQRAFQIGYEQVFGPCSDAVLSDADVERSLRAEGAAAYVVRRRDRMAGGAIVRIDRVTGHNHLELLFVRVGMQGGGVGQALWSALEERYPETVVWETCTPRITPRRLRIRIRGSKIPNSSFWTMPSFLPIPSFKPAHLSFRDPEPASAGRFSHIDKRILRFYYQQIWP